MKTKLLSGLTAVILLLISMMNFAQAPTLGTAANFVIFSTVGAVGNTGFSQVTGNVGTNSGAITGFGNVNGVMHNGDGASAQCSADLLIAYNQLNATVPTFFPAPLLGNGQILNAGVYSISGAATLNLGLTFNAQGNPNAVFIMKIQGPFSASASSKVYLINGAMACNVFWKVEGLVSMAAGTTMRGTVIANNAAINMNLGDTLEGRALSTTGAVNVYGVMAYTPIGCGSPLLTGPAAPSLGTAQCYVLFSSSGPVTNAGITYATGDIGTNVGLTTGFNPLFVTGMIHPIPDVSTAQVVADLEIAYTYLNTLTTDIELLYPAQFGNELVLTPHTYLLNAATVFTGNLYLNAEGNSNAVFVIKINGALLTSTYSNVILTNGTLAKNVYWKVDGAVTISDYSAFKGTIVCNNGAMLLTTGVNIDGRAMTTTGALGTTAITATMPPGCGGTLAPSISNQPANQTVCVGNPCSFSVVGSGTGITYQWRKGLVNLVNGGTVSGATSPTLTINPVSLSDAVLNYNVVITGTFTPSVTSNNAALTVNALPVPIITGSASLCANTTGNVYSTQVGMTGYLWTISAGGIITGGAGTNVISVNWNSAGAQSVSVNCTNPSNCTALLPTTFNVLVNPRPNPTISGPPTVCEGTIGNVYTTDPGMTGYTWNISSGGTIISGNGTNSIIVTWNLASAQSVSVNYSNFFGCAATVPTILGVTVFPLSVAVITGPTPVCEGTTGNVFNTQIGMTNYMWAVSAGGVITSGGTTANSSATVTWSTVGPKTVTVSYTNISGCTTLVPTVFNVTLLPLPVPTLNGEASMCVNSGYYDYMTETGMTNYVWTTSPGGLITWGQGSDMAQVKWSVTGPQWISVSYTNLNGCSPAIATNLNINVNPLPGNAGTISGLTTVCAGAMGIPYSTTPIINAVSYVWTLPAGATIASGAGTSNITVNYAANTTSGTIVVYGNNLCGDGSSSSLVINVNPLPATAGMITGENSVCQGVTGVTYSIAILANTTSYNWTVPSGATIVSGTTTNTITVNFGMNALSGNISVYGSNACGNGVISPLFIVTVNPIPENPLISVAGEILTSNVVSGNQWYFEGNPVAGATGQTHVAGLSGLYWDVITLNGCSSDTSNNIYVALTGINELGKSRIVVYPVPNDGHFTVSINDHRISTCSIMVYNSVGLSVYKSRIIEVKGITLKTIDLHSVPDGVYSVLITINNEKIVKRIIVNR